MIFLLFIIFTATINTKNLEIPVSISYDDIFYSPIYERYYDINKTTYIGKIPIQLLGLYNEFINTKYQLIIKESLGSNYIISNNEKLTFLSILLAMHYTESRFNSNAQTSSGNAVGLGQLYKPTAEWLLSIAYDKFSKYFMIRDNKIIYLYTTIDYDFQNLKQTNTLENWDLGIIKSQILTSAEILINYKSYNPTEPFIGVKRYNGAGQRAINYAILVLKRSVLYQLWIMENTGFKMPSNTKSYNNLIHDILNNNVTLFRLVIKNSILSDNENIIKLILNDVENSLTFDLVKNNNTRTFKYTIGTKNIPDVQNINIVQTGTINLNDFIAINSKNCNTYINIYFRRRSVFSYFYNIIDMVESFEIGENKNNNFYVYYLEDNKRIKLEDKLDIPKFKNKTLFINIPQSQIKNKNMPNISQYFTILLPKGIIVRVENLQKEISIICN